MNAPNNEKSTYIIHEGKNLGPYADAEIFNFLSSGHITIHSKVYRPNTAHALYISEVPEFQSMIEIIKNRAAPQLSIAVQPNVSAPGQNPFPIAQSSAPNAAAQMHEPEMSASDVHTKYYSALVFIAANLGFFVYNLLLAEETTRTYIYMAVQVVFAAVSGFNAYSYYQKLNILKRPTAIAFFAAAIAVPFVFAMILVVSAFADGFNEDPDIDLVYNGYMANHTTRTVGDAVDAFLENEEWESGVAQNGQHFVNVRGGMTYDGKPVNATLQFLTNPTTGSFQVGTFELNGIPQNVFMTNALISKIYTHQP